MKKTNLTKPASDKSNSKQTKTKSFQIKKFGEVIFYFRPDVFYTRLWYLCFSKLSPLFPFGSNRIDYSLANMRFRNEALEIRKQSSAFVNTSKLVLS